LSPVIVAPSRGVPEIVGSSMLSGASAATAEVGALTAAELPARFVPVTATRSDPPTSACVAT
jgi:hypothetical protein